MNSDNSPQKIGSRTRHSLERRLRRERPEPSGDLVRRLSAEVSGTRRTRTTPRLRIALAVAASAAFAVPLSAFGAAGYAASAARHVAHTAAAAVSAPGQQKKAPSGPSSNANGTTSSQTASSSAAAEYGSKVTMCHNGHEISVGSSAVPSHVAQGDTVGSCPAAAKGK